MSIGESDVAGYAATRFHGRMTFSEPGTGSPSGTNGIGDADAPGSSVAAAAQGRAWQAEVSGVSVTIHGAPVWRDTELADLARAEGNAAALVNGYRRWGDTVVERLSGAFALAVHDRERDAGLLATDRSGICPVFYAAAGPLLVFGDNAQVVADHPRIGNDVSAQALVDYLYFHVVPGPGTVYSAVSRLLPGHRLVRRGGEIRVEAYWRLPYREDAPFEPVAAAEELRSLLDNAVCTAAAGHHRPGAFLSGGTDSSTVTGMLGRVTGQPPRTYSIGFDAEGYDEMEYARIVARHFGADHHEYYVTPQDVVDAVPRVAAHYDQPFGNASAVPAYYCARMAEADGVDCLLAGDGGDELFGGNYRYAKQSMLSRYEAVPQPLRRGLLEPVLFGLPGLRSVGALAKVRSYVEQARTPMPRRMEAYNLYLRLGAERILHPDLLQVVDRDHPSRLTEQAYREAYAESLVNRMLSIDMRFTLADSDLPKVSHACELAGVGVRYPMLDDRLVEFSGRVPPGQKVRGRVLRHFYKEALRDFLPAEVIAKTKQGFGLPFGLWLASHSPLWELAGDSLEALKRRRIVRPELVDELLDRRHREHAAYYGTLIWILMMLEQWLAARGTSEPWKR